MGIKGLLQQLKAQSTDLARFMREQFPNRRKNGERVRAAVDASTWLYRGCFCCATDLALGKPAMGFVYFVLKLIKLLDQFDIDVILVFDGEKMPLKKDTNTTRRETREAARKAGFEKLREARSCSDKDEQNKCNVCKKSY